MVKLNGYNLTKIGRADGVLQGVLFHVTPPVFVGDAESNYLVASLGLETALGTDQTFAVFLGDANGNFLQDWPCAYSAEGLNNFLMPHLPLRLYDKGARDLPSSLFIEICHFIRKLRPFSPPQSSQQSLSSLLLK